jgi:hypothetical protein
MKYFYSLFKTLLTTSCVAMVSLVFAQNPTTVTTSTDCSVVQNFNDSTGGFTTPSIYSDQFDYDFTWTGPGPNGLLSGNAPTFNPYETSLISPIYTNFAPNGTVVVGFTYTAPANTLYRIRVIRPNVTTGTADILAANIVGPPIGGGSPNWPVLPSTSGTLCLQLNDLDLHNGDAYRFEFTFYVQSNAANVTFDNFALTNAAPAPLPLPVTFLGIVATREKNNVYLRWDVATEIHVKEYDIERSENGRNFTQVGSVPAQEKQVYSYNDLNAGTGILFYRLRSLDLDGSFKYSPIVKLVANNSYANTMVIYPSPAQSQITLQHKKLAFNAKAIITTMDGKVIKALTPGVGTSNTIIDVSNLSAGMYILRLDDGNGKIETSTFVKQ